MKDDKDLFASEDNGLWGLLLLILFTMPSLSDNYKQKELEEKVAKLEGKLETIEKIIT